MTACAHPDFEAKVSVNRFVADLPADEEGRESRPGDDPHSFAAEIHVRCKTCGEQMGFRCADVGMLPDRPCVSPDALELRVPLISPSELQLLGPLAAMARPSDMPGFAVRVRGDA